MPGAPGATGPAGANGATGPTGPAGSFDATKVIANQTTVQAGASFNVGNTGAVGSDLTVGGKLVLGNQPNQTLNGAQVATLTGGGNADSLHTHAGLQHAWIDAGKNDTYSNFVALTSKYPLTQYEWGIQYNSLFGQVHKVVISSWNGGVRVMTEDYLEGDGTSSDPPNGGFWRGGAAWFYNTQGTFDDACTGVNQFKHEYWQWANGQIQFNGGNGCGGGEWFVRPL